jgi:hypothetical protein
MLQAAISYHKQWAKENDNLTLLKLTRDDEHKICESLKHHLWKENQPTQNFRYTTYVSNCVRKASSNVWPTCIPPHTKLTFKDFLDIYELYIYIYIYIHTHIYIYRVRQKNVYTL